MNPELLPKIINSIGLFCDIIGAFFVAWEVVKQNGHKQYETQMFDDIGTELKKTPEFEKTEKDKYQKMKIGLKFLVIGFLLQMASNWTCLFF